MKPLNKHLLPKRNKYTHKEILDLSSPVIQTRLIPISRITLTTAIFLLSCGILFFWIPGVNPITMSIAAKSVIGRWG